MQFSTRVVENSIFISQPYLPPYKMFPVDILHLFCNIGTNLIGFWFGERGSLYEIHRSKLAVIDQELTAFRTGCTNQLAPCPGHITVYKEKNSVEVKEFILSYSLVVRDGVLDAYYLPEWRYFVNLLDICWRGTLSVNEVREVDELIKAFYQQYEENYYGYDPHQLHLCRYVFHLLLHLADYIDNDGPSME